MHEAPSNTWDVIVVGHGAAGLTTALAYLEGFPASAGARVLIIEASSEPDRGGSTAWTTAGFRLDQDGQLDDAWGQIVRRTAGANANEDYIEALYDNATDAMNWVRGHGVELVASNSAAPVSSGHRKSLSIRGGGRALVETLTPLIADLGGQFRYDTTAVRLHQDVDGAIDALVVRDADGVEQTLMTKQVVLACGGFEGNPEMLAQHLGPAAHTLDTVAAGSRINRGDGIRMAVDIGADTAGQFDGFHAEPCDARSTETEPLVLGFLYGIVVNQRGERFYDEGQSPLDLNFDTLAHEVFEHQGGRSYVIVGADVKNHVPSFEYLNVLPPLVADTIGEVAHLLHLDEDTLNRTIVEFNAACPAGVFDQTRMDGLATSGLGVPKSNWAFPLAAPYQVWPVNCRICFTFGGLRVDGGSRVLDADGRPIPGLSAAGEITGIFYGLYPAGSSVLRSITFGWLTGRRLSEEATRSADVPLAAEA
jgi:tricarballylate dehydrogenase